MLRSEQAVPAGSDPLVTPLTAQNLKKSLPLVPYRQCPALNPDTLLQLAVLEQGGRQTRPELMPMQFSLWHSVVWTHVSPGCLVALGSGGAQTQMS